MRAAFGAGAHIVELDILTSKDEQLEVFHRATLERPTNATRTAIAVAASADNIRESVGAGLAMNASRHPRPPPSGGRP